MSRINSKDKHRVSSVRKYMHVENNSTTSEQEETQLNTKNSNNPSYVWHHFIVLENKVHAQCQICDRKGKSVKYKFHGTTSNIIYHLETEHEITKKNPTGNVEDENIEDFFEVAHGKAARKKQPIIEIAMLTWMIDDCQPLYLLRVPSDDKARRMIINAYTQSTRQLTELLQDTYSVSLNATDAFKKRITNLILFFNSSPKNTENLRDAQCKLNYQKVYEVLLDVPPFYEATKMLSGVSYATLNMVCCTIHYLKKTIAPPNNKDEDYYAELLYGELDVTASQSSSTNIYSDDEIIDLAVRADQSLSILHGRVQKYKNTPVISQQNSDPRFKKHRTIEPPVTITNMLEQIKATVYLSMCQYWDIPKEITLLSALLDPDTKSLKESIDNLYNNLPKLSLTNEPPNVNQVNYFLLGLSNDSDEEERI
ncbi:5241_t:CDS:2 [Dentiscutata heterogama]|uniref:5241_t:CDS:1 n=1 Tax=Dentiscutata heterogama TaxID=1316150 RepID=A0ACA9M578_9GLOM|nr:5241_t:CDS:2 [Dentiscutata heterogama]